MMNDNEAMVVYYKGKPSKRYSPKIFMPTLDGIKPPRIHCGDVSWISYADGVSLLGNTIQFQTIDGQKWSFDIRKPFNR